MDPKVAGTLTLALTSTVGAFTPPSKPAFLSSSCPHLQRSEPISGETPSTTALFGSMLDPETNTNVNNLRFGSETLAELRSMVTEWCPFLDSADDTTSPGESHGLGVTSDIRTGELATELQAVSTERKPTLKRNEVEIKIHASSVTEHDLQFAEKRFLGYTRMAEAGTVEKPYVPGFDCAGVVERTGKGVKGLEQGQAVIALGLPGTGGWQTHMVTDKALVFTKPEGWSDQEAAAGATPIMVVAELLKEAGNASDKSILINGASGNIGSLGTCTK